MWIRMPLVLLMGILMLGCIVRDREITAPTARSESADTPNRQSGKPESIRPIDLDLSEENTFACSIVASTNQGLQRSRTLVTGSGAIPRAGRGLGRFRYVRWDRGSKLKLLELVCVIPLNDQASIRVRSFAVQLDHRKLASEAGSAALRAAGSDFLPEIWGDDFIHCLYDPNYDIIECEGESCSTSQMLTLKDYDDTASHATYHCPSGCDIIDFTWYSCPTNGGGSVDYGDNYGGNGSSDGSNSYTDGEWCPMDYPNCLWELRVRDQARIDSAFAGIDRNAHELCGHSADAMLNVYSHSRIFRGNPTIPDQPSNPDRNLHSAQVRGGTNALAHIDQDFLDAASLNHLGEVLVHEGLHLIGFEHEPDIPYASLPWPFTLASSCAPAGNYTNH